MQIPGLGGLEYEIAGGIVLIGVLAAVLETAAVIVVCRVIFFGSRAIAVFGYDEIREEPDFFQLNFPFFDVMQFKFYKLELKQHNWRDYIQSDNPVAAALLGKMGCRPAEKVRVKIEFLRMLTRMRLDPARLVLLAGFFETYLKLDRAEEAQFLSELGILTTELNPLPAYSLLSSPSLSQKIGDAGVSFLS